jgi:hypothetical protein
MSDAATLLDSPATPTPPATPAPTPPAQPTPPVPPADPAAPPADPANPTPPADPAAPPADPASPDAKAGNWPDDWREQYAGQDEKLLKRLQRYASPKAALDALVSAQDKIRSGALKASLPDNPTDEQMKQWREENGIPEKPSEYDVSLPDGLVIGEQDKPLVDGFLEAAHKAHMQPAQVKQALSWYFSEQERLINEVAQRDNETRKVAEDELRQEWGAEFRQNINLVSGLLDGAPAGVKENLMNARLADGSLLGNSPQVLRYLTGLARELNPMGTVVPGAGVNSVSAIESEIAGLEKRMRDDRANYFKDEKAQARYRELITARDRFKR